MSTCIETTKGHPSGQRFMRIGRLSVPKGKTHNGMRTHSAWRPLPRQMRPTETLSTPSTAREAKAARESSAKAKVRAKAR